MDGYPTEPRPDRLTRWFPWVRLLRGVRLALDARKMLLSALGMVLLWAGWTLLDRLFEGRTSPSVDVVSGRVLDVSPEVIGEVGNAAWSVSTPYRVAVTPFLNVFSTGQGATAFLRASLASIWFVIVWGLVGGAISRITAVQQATGERIGMITAARFATRRALSLIGAPLAPMIGIGFFAGLCGVMGLLYQIPGPVGATLAGLLAFLPLLAGLMMALLVVGMAAGWPLMIATVAVEAEDAFDALSRSYSYVFGRPGRYGVYILLSWVAGAVGWAVVRLLAALVIHLARWGLAFGGPDGRIDRLFLGGEASGTAEASSHAFWIFFVRLLAHGWIYSYFFTSVTLIYLLLRRDVDGTSFSDLGGTEASDEPFAPEPDAPTPKGPILPEIAG